MFWSYSKNSFDVIDPWKDPQPPPTQTLQSQDHAFNRVKKTLYFLCTYSWFCDCRSMHWFWCFYNVFEHCWSLAKIHFCGWRRISCWYEANVHEQASRIFSIIPDGISDPISAWGTVLICCSIAFPLTSNLILSPSCESSVAEGMPKSLDSHLQIL